VHVGVAVKPWTLPVLIVAVDGDTDTEDRVDTTVLVMVISTELTLVTLPSVALTKRPTFPAVLPAVKVTMEPVVTLSVPIALFVRAHE
jgi:hypothetical protein